MLFLQILALVMGTTAIGYQLYKHPKYPMLKLATTEKYLNDRHAKLRSEACDLLSKENIQIFCKLSFISIQDIMNWNCKYDLKLTTGDINLYSIMGMLPMNSENKDTKLNKLNMLAKYHLMKLGVWETIS